MDQERWQIDYGYVGTGKGKITLYKEQTVVEKKYTRGYGRYCF